MTDDFFDRLDRAIEARKMEEQEASLADLIYAGLAVPPLELQKTYKGVLLKAIVQTDGTVEFGGETFAHLSPAAGAAALRVSGKPLDYRHPKSTAGLSGDSKTRKRASSAQSPIFETSICEERAGSYDPS